MRAKRVGRRMSRATRALFVLVVAVVAAAIGVAVAHADSTWEFGPVPTPTKPGVVVTEEPVVTDSPAGELGTARSE